MKYKEISEGKYSFCIDARKASSDGLAELQGKLSSLGYNLIDYYRNSGCTGELTFTMNQFPYFGVLNGGDAVVHSDPKHFDLLSSILIEEAHFLLDNGCLPEEFSLKEDHPSKEVSLEEVPGGEKCPFPEEITVGGDTYKVSYEKIESAWWVGLTSGKYLVRSRLNGEVKVIEINTELKVYRSQFNGEDWTSLNDSWAYSPVKDLATIEEILVDPSVLDVIG